MARFPSFLLSRVIKYSLSVVLIIFFVSCGIEDSSLNRTEANQTKSLAKTSVLTPEVLNTEAFSGFPNSQILELLLEKHISEIVPKISKSIPEPIKVDYVRLENSFLKMLMQNNTKGSDKKYQFICDENERWIYRCNMETGEIECFSMSSNKLRLLSSVK